jgi:hypothetical protein
MVKYVFLILVFCFSFAESDSQNSENRSDTVKNNNDSGNINSVFQSGEHLKYKVKYGILNGGEADLTVGTQQIGYKRYYRATAEAGTVGIARSLAKIHDTYESYFDTTTCLPIKSIRDINENDYRKYSETLFRRTDNTVINLLNETRPVPPGTLDILSAFYYARRYIFKKEMKKDEIINLTTFFDDQIYIVKIRYKETLDFRTDFGKMKCLRFVPVLESDSPFKDEDDLQIWVSDDGNYIPVFIKIKLPVGSLKCELSGFENLTNPFGKKFIRNSSK